MGEPDPHCRNCRTLRYLIRSREREIESLRRAIARGDEQPSGECPEWTVRGEDPSSRLKMAGPIKGPEGDVFFRVSLEKDDLRSSADVYGIDATAWLAALDDLGAAAGRWEGR